MSRPVSEPRTGVSFNFIGLATAIVCIAPHSGLLVLRGAMLVKEVASAYVGIRKTWPVERSVPSQPAHDVRKTLYRRRFNVLTS